MKVHLLYENADYNPQMKLPFQAKAVRADMEIDTLLNTMAAGDDLLRQRIEPLLYQSLLSPAAIAYRQNVLRDCLIMPDAFRALYTLALEGVENKESRRYVLFDFSPQQRLESAVIELEAFIPILQRLRMTAEALQPKVGSVGWQNLFAAIRTSVSREYLQDMKKLLQELHFSEGVLVKARLGIRLKAESYLVCRRAVAKPVSWVNRVRHWFQHEQKFRVLIDERDESGYQILRELKDDAVVKMANTVACSRDHVRNFFIALRDELAFYIGCLNLYECLQKKGVAISFPPMDHLCVQGFFCKNLYNVTLALRSDHPVQTNTVDADDERLLVITGANQGGKTTFLRSFGQAQLMMSCGMFVAAGNFQSHIGRVFTHFKREEDRGMQRGKLDEELSRLDLLLSLLQTGDFLLMNESFAATNERDGSAIASGVVDGLMAAGVQVLFVTHFYAFAAALFQKHAAGVLFLQAQRQDQGARTFQLEPGEPVTTAFGQDIYKNVFGKDALL